MADGLADIEIVEIAGVAEPEVSALAGPFDIEQAVADPVVEQLGPCQITQGS
jgi:hypothetical protein